jgi:6-phosphofructokinase 1
VIGVPKTVDNDLPITDHTPGFGSAAKFIATSISEIAYDASAYGKGRVNIVEIMGRNAGWLAASSKLATLSGYGPDLIYLPEVPFDEEKFIEDVKAIYAKQNKCLVAVSEGIRDKNHRFIAESDTLDAFGHKQMGGVALHLESLFKNSNFKTRAIELSLLQRAANHLSSKVDIDEAIEVGKKSLEAAVNGKSGKMIILKRISSKPYKISYEEADLFLVANVEKTIPAEMIVKEGNNVNEKFVEYALPLITGENNAVFKDGIVQFAKMK